MSTGAQPTAQGDATWVEKEKVPQGSVGVTETIKEKVAPATSCLPCFKQRTPANDEEGDPSFPFDLVFVFDSSKADGLAFAEALYLDLVRDGLFACNYAKEYENGAKRTFVGIGASDRFLDSAVEHYNLTEEKTEARTSKGITRIYAQNTRQRILLRFFKLRRYGGPHASIEWLQTTGILLDYFCLHDPKEIVDLRKGFTNFVFFPRETFVADLEEYFGEEFAMYFAWLRQLIIFSAPMCIVFAIFFAFEVSGNYKSWSMAAAGYFAPVYAQLFHEVWKRTEKRLAFEFGTLDLDETAEVREGYHGVPRLVTWRRDKKILHEGESEYTIIAKAGEFELPIQHTVPDKRFALKTEDQLTRLQNADPFSRKVVTQIDFDALPRNVVETHYPEYKRWCIYGISIPTTLVFSAAVIVAIYAIDFIREVLTSATGVLATKDSIAISVLNGVVIVGLNTVYPIVTRKLVDWENHRTQEDYDKSYIVKLFLFVFANSFFPIYLNLFKLYVVNADKLSSAQQSELVQRVVVQIFSACVSTVFVSNIQDLAIPFLLGPIKDAAIVWMSGDNCINRCLRSRSDPNEPTSSKTLPSETLTRDNDEDEEALSPHHHHHGNIITKRFRNMESNMHVFENQMKLVEPQPVAARFMSRIILFGFAIIFASIFPLGLAFVFFDCVLVTRVEILRYVYLMRRMAARQVESIGGWKQCIQITIAAAAVTNCLIIAFSTDSLPEWYGASGSWESRLTIFIATEHIVMFCVFAVEYIIPDESIDVQRIRALQRYLMMQEQNRLNYDAVELRMESHALIEENIIDDPSYSSCVVCSEKLIPGEAVRKLPCHHHIHEQCLDRFRQVATVSAASTTTTTTLPAEGAAEVKVSTIAKCLRCSEEIDCRYFESTPSDLRYVPPPKTMLELFAAEKIPTFDMAILASENEKLKDHGKVYGISRRSYPRQA